MGAGVNALASVTAMLSQYNDHVSVAVNLGRIDEQLGKIALREQNPARAKRYFSETLPLYQDEAGAHYSAQRIVEAYALLAQAARSP